MGDGNMATSRLRTAWKPRGPEMKSGERRLGRRYRLSLPMTVRRVTDFSLSGGAAPLRLAGFPSGLIRDISTEGVYFTIDQKLAPGQEIAFTLALPASLTSGTEVFICGRAKVIRTEKMIVAGAPRTGVAASIEKHEIVREELLDAEVVVA